MFFIDSIHNLFTTKYGTKNIMKNSVVKVDNIWVEDLFKWFYTHVTDGGGDGASAIVCSNYREAADWFTEWWRKNEYPKYTGKYSEYLKDKEFLLDKYEYQNTINFHNSNEGFVFTDQAEINMFSHDYIFMVVGDCTFAFRRSDDQRVIRAIKDVQ